LLDNVDKHEGVIVLYLLFKKYHERGRSIEEIYNMIIKGILGHPEAYEFFNNLLAKMHTVDILNTNTISQLIIILNEKAKLQTDPKEFNLMKSYLAFSKFNLP